MKRKKSKNSVLTEIIMLILSVIIMFPIVYQMIASFKNQADINQPLSFPNYIYLENYAEAFAQGNFWRSLGNSVVVVICSIFFIVVMGSLASYAIARRTGKGYKLLYFFFLSGIMIPFQAGMIPLYEMIKGMGLINNIFSVVFIAVGTNIPMAILLYTGFIKSIPRQLEESAMIDGCGTVQTFITIVFPLLTPATASTIIISIIPIWNDFLTPLLFLNKNNSKTLPLGLYNFMTERTINLGPVFAYSVMVCVVPIILFLVLQKHFYKGIVAGAVKG